MTDEKLTRQEKKEKVRRWKRDNSYGDIGYFKSLEGQRVLERYKQIFHKFGSNFVENDNQHCLYTHSIFGFYLKLPDNIESCGSRIWLSYGFDSDRNDSPESIIGELKRLIMVRDNLTEKGYSPVWDVDSPTCRFSCGISSSFTVYSWSGLVKLIKELNE